MEMWPNFFIVGAAKAGTTSLYEYLKDNPKVYMAPVKEPRYFNSKFFQRLYFNSISDKKNYLKLFKSVKDEIAIGEASSSYLLDSESAERISSVVPNSRIVMILRDPVERAYSHYLMQKSMRLEKRSFEYVVNRIMKKRIKGVKEYGGCLEGGLYFKQVKRYFDIFGSKQVKILIFENFTQNPKKTIDEILDFLGVDSKAPDFIKKTSNAYGETRKIGKLILDNSLIVWLSFRIVPQSIRWKLKEKILIRKGKKPSLSVRERKQIETFYRKDIEELQDLLKIQFPWKWLAN